MASSPNRKRIMSTDINFDGFDKLGLTLREVAPHLRYMIVDEVLHRKRSQPLARVNFTALDLAPYLAGPAEPSPDEEEDISDDPTEEGEHEELGDLAEATTPPPDELTQLREASVRWMRHVARETMGNRAACTFKVWFYTMKGEYLGSSRFFAENNGYRPPVIAPPATESATPTPAPAPASASAPPSAQLPVLAAPQLPAVPQPPPPPPPVFEVTQQGPAVALALGADGRGQLVYLDPESIPEARVWRALGRATEDFLGTVGRAFNGIVDLQAKTVNHQAVQLDKSQALVESLATQLLAARRLQAGDEADQKADERQIRVREELGKTFLNELGSLGRVLASSKLGMSPELAELGDLIATSPELTEALRDPSVRALLKEEATRKELAKLLTLAAKQPKPSGESTPPQAA